MSSSPVSTSSSSATRSVSKKAKKDVPVDSGCSCSETEQLPSEDDSMYSEDLEDKMKGRGREEHPGCSEAHLVLNESSSPQCSTTRGSRGRRLCWRNWGRWWTS